MALIFREALREDKEFILDGHKEINLLSGLNDSTFLENIDNDLFVNKVCKVIVAEEESIRVGFVMYSYIYWANCGKGIYLSQAYVKKEFRKKGILKMLLKELKLRENDCKFITDFVGNENEVMLKSIEKIGFKKSDLGIYYRMVQ